MRPTRFAVTLTKRLQLRRSMSEKVASRVSPPRPWPKLKREFQQWQD